MSFEKRSAAALDYFPCHYGRSRNLFRGPRKRMEGDYIAFLGGTDTYGRFVPRPFPALVEDRLGLPCVNFGWMNAGPDAFLNDEAVLAAAQGARAVVLQVPGAQSLTNRYYAVEASELMRRLFPGVDFTEYHFTRHLLGALAAGHPERFAILKVELQAAWVARMGELIDRIGRPVLLVWFARRAPEPVGARGPEIGRDPLFVTAEMLAQIAPRPASVIDATASATALAAGTAGMVFADIEAPAAAELMGPAAHGEAAERIAAHLADMMALEG